MSKSKQVTGDAHALFFFKSKQNIHTFEFMFLKPFNYKYFIGNVSIISTNAKMNSKGLLLFFLILR